KAAAWEVTGPKEMAVPLEAFPLGYLHGKRFMFIDDKTGKYLDNIDFYVESDTQNLTGSSNKKKAEKFHTMKSEEIEISIYPQTKIDIE
ncbi:hypothetical protein, partial [Neisseria sp. MVDL19-042950]|uniref:hypothetical protein n=2 Tax=Neisseria TaxID=482 RepID=UPI00265EE3B5